MKSKLKDTRYGFLNSDPDAFSKYITIIRDTLPSSLQLPVYLSEWGISPSHRELLNDTCYSAAYFVRNILLNLNRLESFGHWCLTDWMKELAFPDTLFHGGLGFFTYNGIKKPSYHAYHFLSKLQKNILVNKEGCCISVDDTENHFSILLYNYSHFSDLYAQGFNLDFSPTERYHVFPNAVDKEISFTLTGIPKGKYTIRQHIVNRKHGSCFDTWISMGAEELHTPEEVERLANLSQPLIIRNTCLLDNPSYHFTYTLEPLEIRLVEFFRKH